MGRDGAHERSPSSPLPLSASALHYQGSEDEEDYKRAIQEREGFRAKHGRSGSRGINSPALPKQEQRSDSCRREAAEAREDPPPPLSHRRAASTEHAGDLRRMKDERQLKKEQAARELEERRKPLAKRCRRPLRSRTQRHQPTDDADLHRGGCRTQARK